MKIPFQQLRWMCVGLLACSFANGAVVHKNDDATVTGELKSITDGKLKISVNNTPVVIALDDISQVVLKEPPAPKKVTVVKPEVTQETDDGPNLGSSLLGALFGGGSHSSNAATPAPVAVAVPTTSPATKPAVATTHPAVVPLMQVTLTDGDQFQAKLQQWAEQKLQMQLIVGPSLQLPSTAVKEIWFGTAEQKTQARALALEPGPEDVAFVAKEKEIIIVKGLVQGMTGDFLQFRYGDQDRKISISKIVGLLLRSNVTAPLPGFHQLIHTDSGDQFSGQLSAIDTDGVTLTTANSPLKILLSTITRIDFVNGRVASLCDLKPTKVEQSPYFGRLMNYQIDKSLTGGELVSTGETFTRGIAVHSRCLLQYDLAGNYDRFKTRLAFEQPEGQMGRVLARITGDGKTLYQNPDARGDQPAIDIDVPLTGVHTLTLEIDFGKDQDVGDRVIWGYPRLLRGK